MPPVVLVEAPAVSASASVGSAAPLLSAVALPADVDDPGEVSLVSLPQAGAARVRNVRRRSVAGEVMGILVMGNASASSSSKRAQRAVTRF